LVTHVRNRRAFVLYVCAVPSMTKGATIANVGVVAK